MRRADHPLASRESLSFADPLDFDHIDLHAASSICVRNTRRTRPANRCGCTSTCPDRAFAVVGAGSMGLRTIPLCNDWAQRELKIVVRDAAQLSSNGRLVLDDLRAAVQRSH
ncbi:MAG TPA: hypothetical protein VGC82_17465 [Rhodopila sp.]